MKILLVSVLFAFHTLQAQGQNKFATCDRTWTKIGCFKDSSKNRVLDEMLLNDRDKHSKYHQPGYRLNWHKWRESTHSLACRCAEKASQKGYTVFGLQFYGECWSGQNAEFNFNREGAAKDEKCVMNLNKPTECVQSSNQECVGTQWTNYVYKLTENPGPQTPDVDGDYSNWSQWTECSKTCGGGEKTRERSCTNPPRQGNGRPCEGEPEESVECNKNPCDECQRVMDIGFIVDSSSSVRRDNFQVVKTFIINLIKSISVSHNTTHVGFIHYNHKAYLDWNFENDVAQNETLLAASIIHVTYNPGGTRTDKALEMALSKLFTCDGGERSNVPHVLIVITDGKTSKRSKKYRDVLKPFKEKGILIIGIGIGRSVDETELLQIADGKKDNVMKVSRFDELLSKLKDILKLFCASRTSNNKPVKCED